MDSVRNMWGGLGVECPWTVPDHDPLRVSVDRQDTHEVQAIPDAPHGRPADKTSPNGPSDDQPSDAARSMKTKRARRTGHISKVHGTKDSDPRGESHVTRHPSSLSLSLFLFPIFELFNLNCLSILFHSLLETSFTRIRRDCEPSP